MFVFPMSAEEINQESNGIIFLPQHIFFSDIYIKVMTPLILFLTKIMCIKELIIIIHRFQREVKVEV